MLPINTARLLFLLLIPSLVVSRATSSIYNSPNMDKLCGKLLTLNGDTLPGTYFSLTSGNYRENLDCILTIRASTRNQRIIIVMDKMDVICGDQLLFYDGIKNPESLINQDQSLQCGRKKYYFRTTHSNTVIIEFLSNNDGKVGKGFILNIAINFPVSSCLRDDYLYRCRNNYCISNAFNCDDRNWCGDHTQDDACR